MTSTKSPKTKIEQLETIRGLAALMVVLYHVPNWNSQIFNIGVIRGAGAMVDLFFVLSGFVIYSAYNDRINKFKDLLKFQFLRFGRLYPVHLLFILVYLGIETLKYILQTRLGIVSHSRPPFVENDFWAFIREFLLIKSFWSNQTAMAVNSPAWSISAEFYTYIIFGLIALWGKELRNLIYFLISVLGLLILAIYEPNTHNFFLRCVTGFFIGCTSAGLLKTLERKSPLILSPLHIPLSILIVISIMSFSHGPHHAGLLIYPASGLIIFSILKSGDNYFNQLLTNKYLVWLGTISYSLYMSHGAVLWFFQQILRFMLHPPEAMKGTLSVMQLEFSIALISTVVYIAISLIVGSVTYMLIEKPCRDLSRKALNLK